MQLGLTQLDGTRVKFDDIKITDAHLYGCSPATLSYLIRLGKSREGISGIVTASAIDSGIRLLMLKEWGYYDTAHRSVAGLLGNMKHERINTPDETLIVEKRFSNEFTSAAIDHYDPHTKTLWDLKTNGWYKVKLMLDNVEEHAAAYVAQLNLGRAFLMEAGYEVDHLKLEVIPNFGNKREREEARQLVGDNINIIIIDVPLYSPSNTWRLYNVATANLQRALMDNYAPICPEESRWKDNIRCTSYCPVQGECIQMSVDNNEPHHLLAP